MMTNFWQENCAALKMLSSVSHSLHVRKFFVSFARKYSKEKTAEEFREGANLSLSVSFRDRLCSAIGCETQTMVQSC